MEIVTCPSCGHPRALGHRCPSCGDTSGTEPIPAQEALPASCRQCGTPLLEGSLACSLCGAPVPSTPRMVAPSVGGLVADAPVKASPRPGGQSRGRFVGMVAAAVVVIAVIVVVALLVAGGDADTREAASPDSKLTVAMNSAAKSLVRNSMTAIESAYVDTGSFATITQDMLSSIEPSITWVRASSGVSIDPPSAAQAAQDAVGWAGTGDGTYEAGTWSQSGTAFGVLVDKMGAGTTFYVGGAVSPW